MKQNILLSFPLSPFPCVYPNIIGGVFFESKNNGCFFENHLKIEMPKEFLFACRIQSQILNNRH